MSTSDPLEEEHQVNRRDLLSDVAPRVQRSLIVQELEIWKNTRFLWRLKLRVGESLKRIGSSSEYAQNAERELLSCETAIQVLEEMLTEIEVSPEPVLNTPNGSREEQLHPG